MYLKCLELVYEYSQMCEKTRRKSYSVWMLPREKKKKEKRKKKERKNTLKCENNCLNERKSNFIFTPD